MPISELLLSFQGRISRGTFWVAQLLLSIAFAVLLGAILLTMPVPGMPGIQDPNYLAGALVAVITGVAAWMSLAICTKRWHDMGRSGWMNLTLLIPYVSIVFWLILGLRTGAADSNEYGEAPGKSIEE